MNDPLTAIKQGRAEEMNVRARIEALKNEAVTPAVARSLDAHPITTAYQVRQVDKAIHFLRVVDDFPKDCVVVVIVKGGLEVWRR